MTKPWLASYSQPKWAVEKIKYYIYVKGRVGWHGLSTSEFQDKGCLLITGTDFKDGTIDWSSCHHVTKERYDQDPNIWVQEDDILITKDGTIGKVAHVKGLPYETTVNSGVFVTRSLRESIVPRFYYWLLKSSVFTTFIDCIKAGTTINHLYQQEFNNFEYHRPPLEEQQTIADFLDYKTQQIDALIEKKKRLIELLKEKRTALISHAVTKGLNPDVKMKDSGVEWLGEIPEHWEVKKAAWLMTVNSGSSLNNDEIERERTDTHFIPVYGGNGILGFTTKQMTREPTLVVGRVGAHCGNIHITESNAWITDNALVARLQIDIGFDYLFFAIKAMDMNRLASRNAQPLITGSQLKEQYLPVPPEEEQSMIASYIRDETVQMEAIQARVSSAIERLQEYRASLITSAVTGQIDLRDWQKPGVV